MDEDGEMIKKLPAKGSTLEMVDIRKKALSKSEMPKKQQEEFKMKEFTVSNKVN